MSVSTKKTIACITVSLQERDSITEAVGKYATNNILIATQCTNICADLKPLCVAEPGIILSTGKRGLGIIYDALFVFHGSKAALTLSIAKALKQSQDSALVVFACHA